MLKGATKTDGQGGYTELFFDTPMSADRPLAFTLGFEDHYFWVSNRAWHPQGPYLRTEAGRIDVAMDIAIGVRPSPMPEKRMPDGLALIPAPQQWVPANGVCEATQFQFDGDFAGCVERVDAFCARSCIT